MRLIPFASILLSALISGPLAGPVAAYDHEEEHRGHDRERRVVFTTNRTGESEIFSMEEDGSDAVNLTNNPGSSDTFPAVSPDGRRIVFTRGRGFARELFVMNVDGTGQGNSPPTPPPISRRPGPRTAGRSPRFASRATSLSASGSSTRLV